MDCAIYCRLSREDEGMGESESIQNQRAMLKDYAAAQGWRVVRVFCDEDRSGADRERPGFLALIEGARNREFQVILCKTQSRFARDMELVERYLHGLFPLWGVRFVAVVDHADTGERANKKARQINGLVNEWYLEDLSENIRAVLDHKRKNGGYIASFPLYGYQKDGKGGMVVEEEAASVVREIYSLCLSGLGKKRIADLLNERGLPNPSAHKARICPGAPQRGDGRWSAATVGRILTNEMYTGTLVQGVKKKATYKSKKLLALPPERWIRVEGHHEPVVPLDTFLAVRALLSSRGRADGSGTVHALSGKVFCLDCGSPMTKTTTSYRGARRSYLRCGGYLKDHSSCTIHSVSLSAVEALVYERLAVLLAPLPPVCPGEGRPVGSERAIARLEREAERRSRALSALYLDYTDGLFSKEEFLEQGHRLRLERDAIVAKKAALARSCGASFREDAPLRPISLLEKGNLHRGLLAQLLDCVLVGERDPVSGVQQIVVRWLV